MATEKQLGLQIPEEVRLHEDARRQCNWKRWGPYLAERQWGTVREDYSDDGESWTYFPHDHARSRAYRWGEDGLLGITDRQGRLCFALALWNERDTILKERLFGLTGPQGNHGEDVKEMYFYLDSTPTHSYMKALYKYPQRAYPYEELVEANRQRGKQDREFELVDTGIFDDDRYFDVFVEYAKAGPNEILARIFVHNRGPETAPIHVLPTIWFRNTWSHGRHGEGHWSKPKIERVSTECLSLHHESLGDFAFLTGPSPDGGSVPYLFTDNETNVARVFGGDNEHPYVKDSFHDYVIHGRSEGLHPLGWGTKAAAHYQLAIAPGDSVELRCRLWKRDAADTSDVAAESALGSSFDEVFSKRQSEANEFYHYRIPAQLSDAERLVVRQAYAGLLWTKQFYNYSIRDWLEGDPNQPSPPDARHNGRNRDWKHLYNRDVISMPDKWEYPWYAAWDLAFHMLPFAGVDPQFSKDQLQLFVREWFMHPNGQIPAYEFAFSDVNPPVHAWSAWRTYKRTGEYGARDTAFLKKVFHKLLLNFTWWINRKDRDGRHIFSGGFLGLDNIGVFDRSQPSPLGGALDQADATAWMAFYCATMLSISLELANEDPAYEDVASKFFEHFVAIADAINTQPGHGLWEEEDGFYYDYLRRDGEDLPLRIRSIVGLIPLITVEVLDEELINRMPGFNKRMRWFLNHRQDLAQRISYLNTQAAGSRLLLAIPSRQRLLRILRYLLDEREFLSPFGIRSLSRAYEEEPFAIRAGDKEYRVAYVPGESDSYMFGGNSNWRGPIWFPINYLVIEALEKYHYFYGDELKVECPAGSGQLMNLKQVAEEIAARVARLFLPDQDGRRAAHGQDERFANDPHWQDLVLFYEYFDGNNGRGLGASHQTGWTALVIRCLEKLARNR